MKLKLQEEREEKVGDERTDSKTNKNLGKTIYRSYAKDTILLSTEQKKERKKN